MVVLYDHLTRIAYRVPGFDQGAHILREFHINLCTSLTTYTRPNLPLTTIRFRSNVAGYSAYMRRADGLNTDPMSN